MNKSQTPVAELWTIYGTPTWLKIAGLDDILQSCSLIKHSHPDPAPPDQRFKGEIPQCSCKSYALQAFHCKSSRYTFPRIKPSARNKR